MMFSLKRQRVKTEEVFDRAEKGFNTGAPLGIARLARRRFEIGSAVTPILWGGFSNRLGQRSQDGDAAVGGLDNQGAIIVASIQQQSVEGGWQTRQPSLQDMT